MISHTTIILSLFLTTSYCSPADDQMTIDSAYADIQNVNVTGKAGSYSFNVTISSPDKGCSQYSDWWEVVSETGDLIYRRILAHSHVSEQPFTRSGGSIAIQKDQIVWVRAHMNKAGYGGVVMKGSAANGFAVETMPNDFAANLEKDEPLPTGCAF